MKLYRRYLPRPKTSYGYCAKQGCGWTTGIEPVKPAAAKRDAEQHVKLTSHEVRLVTTQVGECIIRPQHLQAVTHA